MRRISPGHALLWTLCQGHVHGITITTSPTPIKTCLILSHTTAYYVMFFIALQPYGRLPQLLLLLNNTNTLFWARYLDPVNNMPLDPHQVVQSESGLNRIQHKDLMDHKYRIFNT